MTNLTQADIENQLKLFIDTTVDTDLVTAKFVKNITLTGQDVNVVIELGYPAKSYLTDLKRAIQEHLKLLAHIGNVEVELSYKIISHSVQQNLQPIPHVKNIIAVASGKGGVGKSTTSVNLALALTAEGANVGILDADIYGPSIPTMLGLSGHPESDDGKKMNPKISFGIQTNSIGYLIDPDQPMIWRGPMVTNALQQLLKETNWDNLDYLIIDLPPGTGDIQLTLAQQIPVTAAVIVTTPQDVALIDAQRGLAMFEKVNVPILGIIENMSMHICSNCGHEEAIFGQGGGASMAAKNSIDLLGSLPLNMQIRELSDTGRPIVASDPNGRIAEIYQQIARKMAGKLALKAKDYSSKFPKITIESES